MKIVEEERFRSLQRMAKLWWAGWVLAAAALLGAAWAFGRAAAFEASIIELNVMADNVDRLRANNMATLADLKTFQEHQDAASDAILEMGTYLRERQNQIDWNRRAVVDLTKGKKRWMGRP